MIKLKKVTTAVRKFITSPRTQMFALMAIVCSAVCFAQNTAGNYEAGTAALTTVTEENAFGLNHTQSKYNKTNIRLKKTHYK